MLQPVRRRTWAPKGQTPIQKSWGRHDRLSGISALSLSPVRQRLGFYFRLHRHNIRFGEVLQFLKLLHRVLGRKLVVVLDFHRIHREAVRLLRESHADWLEVEWLPFYAPELNPVEQIWNHSKYSDLANFIPADVEALYEQVEVSLRGQRCRPDLIQSFFKFAKLEL